MDRLFGRNFLRVCLKRISRVKFGPNLIQTSHFAHIRTLKHFFEPKQFMPSLVLRTAQTRLYAKKIQGKMNKGGKAKMVHITDEELSEVIDVNVYQNQVSQVREKLKKDFTENLSLRSSASNVDNLIVEIEGEKYSLHELAQISKKNPNLIAINMSDFPEGLKPAMQAITESASGLNPQQDGTMIYLQVPKLTREHREQLSKNAKSLFLKAKEEMRSIQNTFVKDAKNRSDLSEDVVFGASNQIMAMSEKAVEELEKILKTKQKELLGDS